MRKNKGITLVALVVTIVVLLILAAVSINLVLGQNGLIANAKEAREKSKNATDEESQLVNGTIPDYIAEQVNGTAGGSGNGGNGSGGSTNLPTTETTKPYMPGDTFTVVAGTTLDNGLTIQDATENGNQYVWVEVPKTATVYPTAGLNITEFTTDAYTKIEADLHTYTMTYRKGKSRTETSNKDEWYEDTNNTADWYTSEQYTAQKQKMLKSVYQIGGFWVAKYEAGLTEEIKRTSKEPAPTVAPQSKQNLIPYDYVTRTQAKKLAEMVQYTNNGTTYTGSLMFGVQWDLVLKFIETKKLATDATIVSKLNSDSKDIGNYSNSTFTINRGKYETVSNWTLSNTWNAYNAPTTNYVDANANKLAQSSNGNGILLTTGAVDRNCLMNIYDIAGNVWEWTLEYTSLSYSPCAGRGGNYGDTGSSHPASNRNGDNTTNSYCSLGFRLSLY